MSTQIDSQDLTREQLYELVWSKSVLQLSKEYCISDRGLAKLCRRHLVPTPPRGYWAQLEVGKAPKRPPLPPRSVPSGTSICLSLRRQPPETEAQPPEPERKLDEDILKLIEKAKALPPITVSDRLLGCHPLVSATKQVLEAQYKKPRRRGNEPYSFREAPTVTGLNVNVGKDSVRRALCLMNAFIRAVEAVGGTVELQEKKFGAYSSRGTTETVVRIAGEDAATIALVGRTRRELDTEVSKPGYTRYKHIFTGEVSLQSSMFPQGRYFADKKKSRLEDQLNALVVLLVECAGWHRIARLQAEEAQRIAQAEAEARQAKAADLQRRQAELKARQDKEAEEIRALIQRAEQWQQSELLRAYIAAERERYIRMKGPIEDGGKADTWLKWAESIADRFDPLKPTPPSVLEEEITE